jgi:hypothetical protein
MCSVCCSEPFVSCTMHVLIYFKQTQAIAISIELIYLYDLCALELCIA